jgi:isoamyl acetate esterase
VVLRGLSGYNTRWALKVLTRAMEGAAAGADPAAVTVFFGANDASLPDRKQAHQHVPLGEYKSNLRAICWYFKVLMPTLSLTPTCAARFSDLDLFDASLMYPFSFLRWQEKWPSTAIILITPPPIYESARIR